MRVLDGFIFSILLTGSRAADIYTRFFVDQGAGASVTRSGLTGDLGGSCYSNTADLNAIYNEALDMAQVAIDALDNYASSPTVRATLEAFFGIKPDGTAVSAAHTSQFNQIRKRYKAIITDSSETYDTEKLEPAFFCDDGWRWKTKEFYDNNGNPTGLSISDALKGAYDYLYWSPRLKKYVGEKESCGENVMGFVLHEPETLTICPYTWSRARRKDSLKPWRSGEKELKDGSPLGAALSTPATFLHELMHLVSGGGIKDKIVTVDGISRGAYNPSGVAALAKVSVDDAIINADSYQWFATAMYLSAKDWSRTIGGVYRSSAISSRSDRNTSSYQEDNNGLRRRTYFWHRKLPLLSSEKDSDLGYSV